MPMSWLIVMFILNGTPTIVEGFPPKLVPTSECYEQQQTIGALLPQAFPETDGVILCLFDKRNLEVPDVPA